MEKFRGLEICRALFLAFPRHQCLNHPTHQTQSEPTTSPPHGYYSMGNPPHPGERTRFLSIRPHLRIIFSSHGTCLLFPKREDVVVWVGQFQCHVQSHQRLSLPNGCGRRIVGRNGMRTHLSLYPGNLERSHRSSICKWPTLAHHSLWPLLDPHPPSRHRPRTQCVAYYRTYLNNGRIGLTPLVDQGGNKFPIWNKNTNLAPPPHGPRPRIHNWKLDCNRNKYPSRNHLVARNSI